MAETTADVRRDIEMTRERISTTLAQLEQKTNVVQIVRDHPWPALAAAVGVGVLLSGTRADVKAAGATVAATKGASSKLGGVLDDAVANLMGGVHQAFQGHVDSLVSDIKKAIGGSGIAAAGAYAAGNRGTSSGRSSLAETAAGNGGGGSFAGSGASGSPMTASSASGTMATPATGGASASSPQSSGAWAPQTPEGLGGASASNPGDLGPGGIEGTGGQDYRTNRAD